jgi:hypothetical protein
MRGAGNRSGEATANGTTWRTVAARYGRARVRQDARQTAGRDRSGRVLAEAARQKPSEAVAECSRIRRPVPVEHARFVK